MRDPRRQLPRALALGVGGGDGRLRRDDARVPVPRAAGAGDDASAFARRAGEALLGPAGPRVSPRSSSLSVVASAMALLLMAPRVYLAMSRDGLFPARARRAPPGDARSAPRDGAPRRDRQRVRSLGLVSADRRVLHVHDARLRRARGGAACSSSGGGTPTRAGFRAPGYPATPALFVLLLARRRRAHRACPAASGSGRIRSRARRPAGLSDRGAGSFASAALEGRPHDLDQDDPVRGGGREAARGDRGASARSTRPSTRRRPAITDEAGSIVASHSLIPDALYHAFATFGVLMSPDLPLTRRQHEMITTVVSVTNRCHY